VFSRVLSPLQLSFLQPLYLELFEFDPLIFSCGEGPFWYSAPSWFFADPGQIAPPFSLLRGSPVSNRLIVYLILIIFPFFVVDRRSPPPPSILSAPSTPLRHPDDPLLSPTIFSLPPLPVFKRSRELPHPRLPAIEVRFPFLCLGIRTPPSPVFLGMVPWLLGLLFFPLKIFCLLSIDLRACTQPSCHGETFKEATS